MRAVAAAPADRRAKHDECFAVRCHVVVAVERFARKHADEHGWRAPTESVVEMETASSVSPFQ